VGKGLLILEKLQSDHAGRKMPVNEFQAEVCPDALGVKGPLLLPKDFTPGT